MAQHRRITPRWLNARRRSWLYKVAKATGAAAVVYGVATGEEVAALIGVAGALLGGLADDNVSAATDPD